MSPLPDHVAQCRELRQQLQTQRRILIGKLNPAPASATGTFPRSMMMRMFTGKSTLLMLVLAEALPVLLTRYLSSSSLQAHSKKAS